MPRSAGIDLNGTNLFSGHDFLGIAKSRFWPQCIVET
jgi:hypothetical protein